MKEIAYTYSHAPLSHAHGELLGVTASELIREQAYLLSLEEFEHLT